MIRCYKRTDCHSQCAHWLRNDVENITLSGTIMMRNENKKVSADCLPGHPGAQ